MKARDRSIRIGLVLIPPGLWPSNQGPQEWNPTVLSIACRAADFVSLHWYPQKPGHETDAGLLASVDDIPRIVRQTRALLAQYCGRPLGIMVTETNSVTFNPGKQTTSVVNGLFLIEEYLTWLQAGVPSVSWWALHNGVETSNNNSAHLAGRYDFGDYGILSPGGHGLAPNQPYPTFEAFRLLDRALRPDARIVATHSGLPDVHAYALWDGRQLALVLVNRSATTAHTITPVISHSGRLVRARVAGISLAHPRLQTGALSVRQGSVRYRLPPYAAAVLELSQAAVGR